MFKLSLSGVKALLLLACIVVWGVSCTNDEYDMSGDNLNLEVTPFEDGLTLPLGETDEIKLADLLKDVDQGVLDCIDGAYAVRMSDSFDASESLSSLKGMIDIDDVSFRQTINFNLGDVSASDIKVEAQTYEFKQDFLESFEIPEIVMPSVTGNIKADLGLPSVAIPALGIQPVFDQVKIISLVDGPSIPEAARNDNVIDLDKKLYEADTHFSHNDVVPMNVTLASDVKSIKNIVLSPNAKLRLTLELEGSLLASGKIIPDINVDLSNLFNIEANNENILHLHNDWTLTEATGYKLSKDYKVTDLCIEPDDWKMTNAGLTLDKSFAVPVDGRLSFEELKTTTNRLSDPANADVFVDLKIEFIDFTIDDVEVEINPIAISQTHSVDLNSTIDVPEGIEKVGGIAFTDGSGLVIDIKTEGLNALRGLDAKLSTLVISFPEALKVEGTVGNKLTINNVDLKNGYRETVKVTGMDLDAPVGGKIIFNEKIEVVAEAEASGTLHSADILGTDGNSIVVEVRSDLALEDYYISVAGLDYDLDIEDQEINIELPESLSDVKEVEVLPKGSPEFTVKMEFPDSGLDVVPSEEGFTIVFPEMVRFKNVPSSYKLNFNCQCNTGESQS